MVSYPIFQFYDDDSLTVYEAPGDWEICEPEDLDGVTVVFDAHAHVLKFGESNSPAVDISESGEEPDPERLRTMLIRALQREGQNWPPDAPLDLLIPAAQQACRYDEGIPLGEAFGNLLRFLHLKRRAP